MAMTTRQRIGYAKRILSDLDMSDEEEVEVGARLAGFLLLNLNKRDNEAIQLSRKMDYVQREMAKE